MFRRLVRLGSFSDWWRQDNVTPITKGTYGIKSSTVANYRLISITSVLSKLFVCSSWTIYGTQWCASNHPVCLSERPGYLWCTLCLSHTLQSALESGQEARIVQIDFSAAFYNVNHQRILYKLCSVGAGVSVLSILAQFLSNRSQHVMVDGWRSKLVNDVSRVPQDWVFGRSLFLLYTTEHFSILENKLICYAIDSALIAVASSPGVRVTLAESMSPDLV